MAFDVEVVAEKDLTAGEKEAQRAWMREMFGSFADEMAWSDVDWHVFVRQGRETVSHVEIVERTCMAGGQPVRVGGIGGVATRAAWRGRGLASRAMARATSLVCDDLGLEFGLLICDSGLVPFYERLGWRSVAGPLVFDQPGGRMANDGATMVWSCGSKGWPEGEIDLCGLPW